jgi:hypothetical protein
VAKIANSCHRIQETLRKKFAALVDGFRERLRAVYLELSTVEGPLEEQQRQTESIQTRIPALSAALETVEAAEVECVAAKVEENDYTVFSCQDLEFELELVVQSIAKKISFIDNQASSRVISEVLFLIR